MASEKFAGFTDVDDFLIQFDAVATIKSWDVEQKKVAIAAYLEGPALTWYKANCHDLPSYDVVKEKLREQFPSQEDYAQSFYYRRQAPTEQLLSYYYDLDRLALKAGIKEDAKFIRHFIKSVNKKFQELLACRLFSSKDELRKTIMQMGDIFNDNLNKNTQFVELPINNTTSCSHTMAHGDYASPQARTPQSEYDTPQTPQTTFAPRQPQQGTSNTPFGRYHLRPRQLQPEPQRQPFQSNTGGAGAASTSYQQRRGYYGNPATRGHPNANPRR